MHSDSGIKKVFLLGAISILLATGAATALNIEVVNEPINADYVSNDTGTVRIVNITDNNDPLNSKEVGDDFYVNYTYNATDGLTWDLGHLAAGYWYAEFRPNELEGSYIDYRVEEKSGTQDSATATEKLKYGNYSMELMSDIGSRITPDETISLRVNVTDDVSGEPEKNAAVTAYFTNGTYTHDIQGLNNQDGSEYYNSQINTPDNYGGTYILHINASNTADSHIAPEGAVSIPVKMEPPMTGEIDYLEASSGCGSLSFFTECEREAEIATGYNVTGAVPESVNFSVEMRNRSSGEWETHVKRSMQNNSIYEAEATLPDLNTTAYNRNIRLVYNATGKADAVQIYKIKIRDYQVKFGAATSARQGGDYNLELAFERYFSSQPLDTSRINAEINVTNSTHTLRQYTLKDMSYEDGVFQRDVQIGSEWPAGTYNIEVEAEDIYGNTRTVQDSFYVQEVDRTFNITEEIDEEVVTAGEYEFNLTVENLGSSEINLTANASEDIERFTETPDFFLIQGNEERNVTIEFNLTGMRMEDRSGEIILKDEGGFNESAEVQLQIPSCDYREGAYCMEGELNSSRDERGYELKDFQVHYLANSSDEADLQPSADGNLSEVLSFQPSQVEMNSSNNQQGFVANYSAFSPGYYRGQVTVGAVSVPVEFTSSVESTELSIAVPDSIDLGAVPEGGTVTREVDIENTGEVDINSVSFDSTDMSVSADDAGINTGENQTFELEISELAGGGSITVTAESATQQTSKTIDVQAETVPDLSQQASDLRTEINSLQSRVTSSENQNTLNTAALNITEIQNAYNAGNYEKAQRMYQATQANIEEVRSSLNSGSEPETSPADNSTNPAPETDSQSSGGSPFVLIAIIVFVLLLVGFVVFTSYVPEEGDPLYGVLGK